MQNWDIAKKLTAPKLKGTFSAKAALEQLLAGTPLTYKWLSERAVAIRERTQSGNDASNVGSATWGSYFQSPDRPLRLDLSAVRPRTRNAGCAVWWNWWRRA